MYYIPQGGRVKLTFLGATPRLPFSRKAKPTSTICTSATGSAIVAKLAQSYPGLGGTVVRDFRDLARTKMTDARIPEPVIRRWMWHAGDVPQRYYQVTTRAMEEAAGALTLNANRIADRTSGSGGTAVEVARASNS